MRAEHPANGSLVVRRAAAADESTLLGWRNDPWLVRLAASRRTVTPQEHHGWFQETLQSASRDLFVIDIDHAPAGMIRYDVRSPDEVEISIYLLPPHLGQGNGQRAFWATAPEVLARRGVKRVVARVRADNLASLRFFEKLGFRQTTPPAEFYELVWEGPTAPNLAAHHQ